MKSVIITIIICTTVFGSTIFGAFFTDKKLSSFLNCINTAIPEDIASTYDLKGDAEKLEQEYQKIKRYLLLLIHDDEVREIEEHISDIRSALEADEPADALSARNRLKLHIEQLRRLSKFSIEAIF